MPSNPFVSSGQILRVIGVYKMLGMHGRPSELMDIQDAYLAFCFDEACAFIISKMKDGEEPILKINSQNGDKVYSKPSSLYDKYKK